MSVWVLACVVLVPNLATGERVLFGDCSSYGDKIDPIAQTEVGINMLKNLGRHPGLSVIFWDSSEAEADNRCMRLEYDLDLGTYEYSYIDSTGARSRARGRASLTMTPTTRIQLHGPSDEGGLKRNAPSACPSGRSELFPAYISPKELLLLGCCNSLLGRRETLYVLTTEDVSSLDLECARRTIVAATGRSVTTPSDSCADEG